MKNSTTDYNGFDAFRVGWDATFDSAFEEYNWPLERLELAFAWFANLTFSLALVAIIIGFKRIAVISAAISCALSLCVLPHWWQLVIHYPGYWFWWGSMMMALFAALYVLPRQRNLFVDDYGKPKSSAPSTPALT